MLKSELRLSFLLTLMTNYYAAISSPETRQAASLRRSDPLKSADRGDCASCSVIGINLQEMPRIFRRRRRRAGCLFIFSNCLQQRRRKCHGKIGEELIRLGGKASTRYEADQRTLQCSDK